MMPATHSAVRSRIFLVLFGLAATPIANAENLGPELTAPISSLSIKAGAAAPPIVLHDHLRDPDVPGSAARIHVRLGSQTANIYLALFDAAAPQTVANFKSYMASGAFASNFFHRSIPGFIMQSGGFRFNDTALDSVPTLPPIANEPGISNTRGTIAMAKLDGDPNSATSQWFINLADNSSNLDFQNGGFTVFGRVLGGGMTEIIDVLATVPTYDLAGFNLPWTDIPLSRNPFSDNTLYRTDFIETSAFSIAPISHTAVADDPSLVDVSIVSGALQITAKPGVAGSTTVRITTTDLEGATLQTEVPVTVLSSDANLGGLTLSGGSLSPAFESSTTAYTMAVANNVTSTTVTPSASHGGATILVNGNVVASGTESAAIPLNVPTNTITIEVTAEDGTSKRNYSISVTRAPSDVAELDTLTLSNGSLSPDFSSGTTTYALTVANVVTSITVTATVSDPTATLLVNGDALTSGTASGSIPLSLGSNTITVEVTAQDGTTKKNYTVSVTRAPSDDAALRALTFSAGSPSPAFASGTSAYTMAVANSVTGTTVTPSASHAEATVKVNGTTVASGSASASIPLNIGANTITIEVTAQDETTKKTYTVTITRAASNVANLGALTLSAGSLSPAFASGTSAYTMAVANSVTGTTVTPSASHAEATVKVNGTTVASGSASASIPLNVGANTIPIEVTAQNGTTKRTYTVTITRAPSSNAKLKSLVVKGHRLDPKFKAGKTIYQIRVNAALKAIQLLPEVQDKTAEVFVNGRKVNSGVLTKPIGLNKTGKTLIKVLVSAQNKQTMTYRITVTRP